MYTEENVKGFWNVYFIFGGFHTQVRSLTQRLNNDEMRRSSAFPRSLFAQHSSLFDNLPRYVLLWRVFSCITPMTCVYRDFELKIFGSRILCGLRNYEYI